MDYLDIALSDEMWLDFEGFWDEVFEGLTEADYEWADADYVPLD